MPFYLRLASRSKNQDADYGSTTGHRRSTLASEFMQGIGFGLGMVLVMLGAYLVLRAHMASFPDLQSFQNFWLSFY